LGIGDWGLGPSPIPNPQSPIPNPQSRLILKNFTDIKIKKNVLLKIKFINKLIIILDYNANI